jgi:ATP-dependent helicase/nuclease subunit B
MPQRIFLTWNRQLLPQVSAWLSSPWTDGPLNLADTLVVVPAAEAGRRLRESLARTAATRGAALLPPRIATPEAVVSPPSIPSLQNLRACELALWTRTLLDLALDSFRAIFPFDPPQRDQAWALSTAAELLKLRSLLDEARLDFATAARRLGPDHEEAERWQQLAALESIALASLSRVNLPDLHTERLRTADSGTPPEGIRRIVVAAVPDASPLLASALDALEKHGTPVTILIHAPESEAPRFLPHGNPVPQAWTTCEIPLSNPEDSLLVFDQPEDAAAFLTSQWTAAAQQHADLPGIGSADPEVTAAFLESAAQAGFAAYDPAGLPFHHASLAWTLQLVRDLIRHDSITAATQILAIPGLRFPPGDRAAWDQFIAASIPASLTSAHQLASAARKSAAPQPDGAIPADRDARIAADAAKATDFLTDLRRKIASAASLTPILEFLGASLGQTSGPLLEGAASAIIGAAEATDAACATANLSPAPADRIDFLLHLLKPARLYPPQPEDAEPIAGWLELPWNDNPHLFIAGANEGMIPDSSHGDAWLPDSSRLALGLRANDSRLARDSFLLTSMLACRRTSGKLALLSCRLSAAHDPLRPSRLLFRCPPSELPARVIHLFAEKSGQIPSRQRPAWQRPWRLEVPPPQPDNRIFQKISVTQFADYLACPFRFYLKHALRMQPFDPHPVELDPRGFGNAIHAAIERLHREPALASCSDAREIEQFLDDAVTTIFHHHHGPHLAVPLRIQLETARRRLATFARTHAETRAEGWRTFLVEASFPTLKDGTDPIEILGQKIQGRIDLIERNENSGNLRIIDYKTGKSGPPVKSHLRRLRKGESPETWKSVTLDGKPMVWTNLQLPFYAAVVSRIYQPPMTEAGYITLPASVQDAKLLVFDNLTPELCEAAETCAAGIVNAIRHGIFWPPASRPTHDDFKGLAPDGAEQAFLPIDPAAFRAPSTPAAV